DCRVGRADEGIAPPRLAREERPDLIYLDVEMPAITGAEVCRLLKADPLWRSVPIVLVSSHDRRDDASRCGADLFLAKPVDEPTLLESLETFLHLQARLEPRRAIDWPLTFWREGSSHSVRMRDVSLIVFFVECRVHPTIGS